MVLRVLRQRLSDPEFDLIGGRDLAHLHSRWSYDGSEILSMSDQKLGSIGG
jgi:hypothetical protein